MERLLQEETTGTFPASAEVKMHCRPVTLLPAPILTVQIMRSGGPAFLEIFGVISMTEKISGTHSSFSGAHV